MPLGDNSGGGGGWGYSSDLLAVLQQYKEQFGWVWTCLDKKDGGAGDDKGTMRLSEMLPGEESVEKRKATIGALIKW